MNPSMLTRVRRWLFTPATRPDRFGVDGRTQPGPVPERAEPNDKPFASFHLDTPPKLPTERPKKQSSRAA